LKFEHYGAGIAKGLTVTMKNLLRSRVTTQYPEKRLNVSRRTRGNQLVWNQAKCTGCTTCARTCPQGVIRIQTSVGEDNGYAVDSFEVDTGYCISCGLCVEACPYDVLHMGFDFELARYRRRELVQTRDDMAGDRRSSGYFSPARAAGLPEQELLIDTKESRE
jgi:NADH-quinone oxidoreductase chain I